MEDKARPAERMTDLTPAARAFLNGLSEEDVDNLKHGLKLVSAFQTLGTAAKWVIITLGGLLVATVALGESAGRIWTWFRH